jgi:urease accessory protein
MDDDRLTVDAVTSQPALNNPSVKRWEARLSLEFRRVQERTYLAKNLHIGPLVLQKTLHPEGEQVCHGVIIHPPGGVAGGDALTLNVNVAQNAHTFLTTPGAGKWYKANGQLAIQHLQFKLERAACLEWLPQENILFDGAQVKFNAEVNLVADAQYVGWEILCFGRQAQNEVWETGGLQQALTIRRDDELIWNERTCLKPEHDLIKSIVGLNGNAVSASFVIAAGTLPVSVLSACRAVQPKLKLDIRAKYGVTALPQIFAARYVGQSAQSARQYFEALWQILRPWYAGREVTRPRIWNT